MSTGRGRSWRPEKTRRSRDSRRRQVRLVSALLIILVGVVAYLVTRPRVPALSFVSVIDAATENPGGWLPPSPNAPAELSAEAIAAAIRALHERNPKLVNAATAPLALAESVQSSTVYDGQKLVIYVNCNARVVPDPDADGQPVLEVLDGSGSMPPVRFASLLESLRNQNASLTILLLDLHGLQPGLAGGSLATDFHELIQSEVTAAANPTLTVICAATNGERSWEYFASDVSRLTDSPRSSAADATDALSPADADNFGIHGTVFSHFVADALLGGHAATPETLFNHLRDQVGGWVRTHYGETQTVIRITSGHNSTAEADLLSRVSIPATAPATDSAGAEQEQTSRRSAAPPVPPQKSATASAEGSASAIVADDENSASRFRRLLERHRTLAQQAVIPAAMPAEWIAIENDMLAAETFVVSGTTTQFNLLYDRKLIPGFRRLEERAKHLQAVAADEQLGHWICFPTPLTQEDRTAFLPLLKSSGTAADTVGQLPADLQTSRARQRAFVTWFLEDFRNLATTIPTLKQERDAEIGIRVRFLRNLSAAGWKQDDRPYQLALLADLLASDDADWNAELIPILARLIQVKQSCLQTASGAEPDGTLLRRDVYAAVRNELEQLLSEVTAAERWLATGRSGAEMARNRLEHAEQLQKQLSNRTRMLQRLTAVRDHQIVEIPRLIEFLAGLMETTELSQREIESAGMMATAALNGDDPAAAFPPGVLNSNGIGSDHIAGMFALTRNLRVNQPEESDERHYQLLKNFVRNRLSQPASATERFQRLRVPDFERHPELLRSLYVSGQATAAASPLGLQHTGLWMGFWSIRLLEALGADSTATRSLWQDWNDFILAHRTGESSALIKSRARLAVHLQSHWQVQLQSIQSAQNDLLFTDLEMIRPVIGRDLQQHINATENVRAGNEASDVNGLYSAVFKRITGTDPPTTSTQLDVLQPSIELDGDNRGRLPIRVSGAAKLLVLNDGLAVTNSDAVPETNWQRIGVPPADATGHSEAEITLTAPEKLRTPRPLLIAAVDADGIVTALRPFTVYPSSETQWEIDMVRVDGKALTLVNIETAGTKKVRRLILLPTTKDPESGDDAGVSLMVRLRLLPDGTATKASVQLFDVASGKPVWREPQVVTLNAETNTALLALREPPSAVVPNAPTATTPAEQPMFDFSRGFRFEITPADVQKPVTSSIEIQPESVDTGATRFIKLPKPVFDPVTNSIELQIERADQDLSTALQPAKIPVEVFFSRPLAEFLRPGTPTKSQNVPSEGQSFQFRFDPQIESALSGNGLEFGIHVAGIPAAWQWNLIDGRCVQVGLTRPELRVELSLENADKVMPVRQSPALLLAADWPAAQLRTDIHLHGVRFDRERLLTLNLRNVETNQSVPILARPLLVTRRQTETVRVRPGEGDAWVFGTETSMFGQPQWNPKQFNFQDGRYEVVAELRPRTGTEPSIQSSAPLIIDSTQPLLPENFLTIPATTLIGAALEGTLRVNDPESGIAAIRIGLETAPQKTIPVTKNEPTLVSETSATVSFRILPSEPGYPVILPQETDTPKQFALHFEVQNGAGLVKTMTSNVTFIRPGKPKEEMKEAAKPGGLIVKFPSLTPYQVSIAGPTPKTETRSSPVAFSDLKPGRYTVEWQTDGLGRNKGSRTVTVKPGETLELDTSKK